MHGVFSIPIIMVEDPAANFDFVPGLGSAPIDIFYSSNKVNLELIKIYS